MEIRDVIDYVVHTPNNSNPAVLRSLLEDLVAPGPGPEPPAPVDDRVLLPLTTIRGTFPEVEYCGFFEDTVQCPRFTNEEIIVYLDGVKYTCLYNQNGIYKYGGDMLSFQWQHSRYSTDYVLGADSAEFPFALVFVDDTTLKIGITDREEHTIKILAGDEGESRHNFSIIKLFTRANQTTYAYGPFILNGEYTGKIIVPNIASDDYTTVLGVVLYNGSAIIAFDDDVSTIAVSGNATKNTDNTVTITGRGVGIDLTK